MQGTRRHLCRFALAVLVPLALVGAACGGGDDDGSTAGSSATTAAAAGGGQTASSSGAAAAAATRANEPGRACIGSGDGKGEKIVVGSIQTDSSSSAGFPEISQGAKACFDAINRTGGINGRPVDFAPCNDSADAVQGEKCARDLIDAKAVAVLGGICFSCFSAPVVDVLGKADVPYVGGLPVLANDYTQENFLAITNAGGSAALYANAAYIAQTAKQKGTPADVVEVNANVGAVNPTLEQQVKKLGGNYVARIDFDPASSDLASVAQQAIDKKPNFVSVQTDGPNTVKIVTSLRSQGYTGDIVILGTAADPQSIEGMGDAAEGVSVAAFFEDLGSGTSPDAEKFQADMTASGADPKKTLAATGYAGAYVTAEALFNAAAPIGSDAFKQSLLKLDGLQPLFGGRLSYKNAAATDFPRTFYYTAYGNLIEGGKLTPTGTAFNWYTGETVE